jgi:hypothetical protein
VREHGTHHLEEETMRKDAIALLVLLVAVTGCDRERTAQAETGVAQAAGDDQAKIANAESAAPPVVARAATIMDWPHMEGGEMRQLRAGTNGWTCFPSTPESTGAAGEDPMCLDEPWLAWADAWMNRTTPQIGRLGIGYMLQGDRGASNIDPYATGRTADNQWVQTGPHVMIITPDPSDLDGLPTDPNGGGPYVMWKGTPYAHIMVPVQR